MMLMMRPRWWISLLCFYGLMRVGHQSSPNAQNGNWCFFRYSTNYCRANRTITIINRPVFIIFYPGLGYLMIYTKICIARSCFMLSNEIGPIRISDSSVCDECVSVSPPARRERRVMKSVFSSLCRRRFVELEGSSWCRQVCREGGHGASPPALQQAQPQPDHTGRAQHQG